MNPWILIICAAFLLAFFFAFVRIHIGLWHVSVTVWKWKIILLDIREE